MKTISSLLCMTFYVMSTSVSAQNTAANTNDPDYFPIAVWLQAPDLTDEYKANGINLFVGVHQGLNSERLEQFKSAEMKFICSQNEFARNHQDEPLIYGWMHGDEPDNAQWNRQTNAYDPCIDPEIIINDYNEIKENDPTRPVYLNLGRGVAVTNWVGRGACRSNTGMYKVSENGYLKGCNIASFDVYPVNSSEDEVEDSLWYVAKGIDNLQKWSDFAKPVWCWIETTRIGEDAERKPTPAEVKSEVWMALIHGASGFGYFCHSFYPKTDAAALLHDKVMITAVNRINRQVTDLARVLNSPNTSGFAIVKSSNPSVPVDLMTKKQDEANYLFAVAMRPGTTKAVFEVSQGNEVEVIGEERNIKITNGQFSDEFSDYDVHLYKIK